MVCYLYPKSTSLLNSMLTTIYTPKYVTKIIQLAPQRYDNYDEDKYRDKHYGEDKDKDQGKD